MVKNAIPINVKVCFWILFANIIKRKYKCLPDGNMLLYSILMIIAEGDYMNSVWNAKPPYSTLSGRYGGSATGAGRDQTIRMSCRSNSEAGHRAALRSRLR